MPYLGNVPAEAYSQMSYQDLTGGSGTSFTLDYPVGNENEIEVFVNNVRQEPTVAYTTAGTALTMTGTIAATDDFYVVFQGKAQQTIGIPEKQTDGTYLFGNALTVDADGATVATFDRATSDGTIIDVQKDGTTVGSIGAKFSGRSYIASGSSSNTGIRFDTNFIAPADATGANRDNAINLGSSGNRFKDLYLSGGAYLGGTGSANLLHDYEEGTWTPVLSGATTTTYTSQIGQYTKIGNLVYLFFDIHINSVGDGSPTTITGLPFAQYNNDALAVSYWSGLAVSPYFVSFQIGGGPQALAVGIVGAGPNITNGLGIFGNSARIIASGCYRTSA